MTKDEIIDKHIMQKVNQLSDNEVLIRVLDYFTKGKIQSLIEAKEYLSENWRIIIYDKR